MRVAQEKAREEAFKREFERQRRPSRFQVVPAPDVLYVRQMSDQLLDKVEFYKFVISFVKTIFYCSLRIAHNLARCLKNPY